MLSREEKLKTVLLYLSDIEVFSIDEVQKQGVATKHFLRQTVNCLIRDGLLQQYDTDGKEQFQWTEQPSIDRVSSFIDRQIRGSQVKTTPATERPRERLLLNGTATLTLADLLSILIRVGIQGESAIEAGRKVANFYSKSLPNLRKVSVAELRMISKAVNVVSYAQIMAGIELGRRLIEAEMMQPKETTRITSTATAVRYCCEAFRYLAQEGVQEEFHIVTLDTKLKPIQTHRITVGTLDASLVHPREVFRPAIRDACSAILLVHNHPSGDSTPSREDRQVTDRLTEAGKLLGINVLDHIIVTRNGGLSLSENP